MREIAGRVKESTDRTLGRICFFVHSVKSGNAEKTEGRDTGGALR